MLIPKIARGASGKAEVTDIQNAAGDKSTQLNYSPPPFWELDSPNTGPGTDIACYYNTPWQVAEDATIGVPSNAAEGVYQGFLYRDQQDTNSDGRYDTGKQVFFTFEVVCLTAVISATEIFRDASKFRISFTATVQGGTTPYSYNWSSGIGTLISGQGSSTIVVEFDLSATGSVSLWVQDSSVPPCTANVSFPIGTAFTVSTNPGGNSAAGSPGTDKGTRDTMTFTVEVLATANATMAEPPATITFELPRPSTGDTDSLVGQRVEASDPPQYKALWAVTQVKGRWNIKVQQPHRSNTAVFKVNKREQIVKVADSWKGADQSTGHGGAICDDVVRYIYSYVGLDVSQAQAGTTTDLYDDSVAASGSPSGAMAFYKDANSTVWQHVGVLASGGVVDQNCGIHDNIVDGHSATHPDLQTPTHYNQGPIYRDLEELITLDNE